MSKAYIIDKDGIIIDEVYVMTTHKTSKGKMIKPKSAAEDRMLVEYSNLQKKIKALLEEMKQVEAEKEQESTISDSYTRKVEEIFTQLQAQEHEQFVPGQLLALMEQWSESSGKLSGQAYLAESGRVRRKGIALLETLQEKKLEYLTAQAAAAAQIATLREELQELSRQEMCIGEEGVGDGLYADMDQYVGGTITELEEKLDDISIRIFRDDPPRLQQDLQELEALSQRLDQLPEDARRAFACQISRETEMQRIAERLESSGWELLELQRGESIYDDCCLFIQGSGVRKAAIRFQFDGRVEIISHFQEDAYGTRNMLQQLVLETIQESGEKAKGKCMDAQLAATDTVPEFVFQAEPDQEASDDTQFKKTVVQRKQGVEQA